MKKVRVAIVGCGNIGKRHIAILSEQDEFELVAICDSNHEQVSSVLTMFNGISTFYSFEEMLTSVKADLIVICTPHYLHSQMSILALNSGYDVLCEKPMALSVAECKQMNSVAKSTNQQLWVVHQNRYNIPIEFVKLAFDENKLGNVYMIQCNVLWNRNVEYYSNSDWRGKKSLEGGALHTQASHFIDLITWWFGDVVEANTFVKTRNHAIEFEDCGVANLKFSSGVIGNLSWTTNTFKQNYEGSITIIAEKGTVKIGGKYLNKLEYWEVENYPLPKNIDFTDKPNVYDKYKGSSSNHDKLYSEILKKYNHQKYNLVDGIEAQKTSEAIELIYANVFN